MSHNLGTDEHYLTRDVETHRKKYAECYQDLRLSPISQDALTEIEEKIREKDQEIKELKETVARIQPLVEFVNSFDTPENLKKILDFLKDDFAGQCADEKLRPQRLEFSSYVSDRLDEIAGRKGITRKEALEQLVEENLETMKKGEEEFKKLEKRAKKDAE